MNKLRGLELDKFLHQQSNRLSRLSKGRLK